MINGINWFNRIYQKISLRLNPRNINSAKLQFTPQNDTFEKEKNKIQHFKITSKSKFPGTDYTASIAVEQNPKDKAVIYEKIIDPKTQNITKVPMEISIAKSQEDNSTTFHILDKKRNEIGYVIICDWKKFPDLEDEKEEGNSVYLEDYPELGIVGDRITIDYLQNNNDKIYSGIGKVADQIAIEYCLKEGLTPNIISLADTGSLIAHYKRGRRYFKIEKNSPLTNYETFIKKYGTDAPNEVIKKRLKESQKYGRPVNCNDLAELYMYMPQEIIQKYLQIIKENPILH